MAWLDRVKMVRQFLKTLLLRGVKISRKSQKTVTVVTFCIFSFCLYGRQRSSRTSGSTLITAGAPRRSSPLRYFSYPHPSPSRRPTEQEWGLLSENGAGQLALRPRRLSNSENVVKDCQRIAAPSLRPSHTSWISPSSPRKTVCSHTWWTSLRPLPFSWERHKPFWLTRHGPERISWHSRAGHSPFRQRFWRWKPLRWDFSDLPPPPPFLLLSI